MDNASQLIEFTEKIVTFLVVLTKPPSRPNDFVALSVSLTFCINDYIKQWLLITE